MGQAVIDFNTGYDAFVDGQEFDAEMNQDWQDGWLDAAADNNEE